MSSKCDIIIPVYNSLNYTTACIESVLKYTDYPFNLIIVDDGSHPYAARRLDEYGKKHPNVKVVHNSENLGFIKTANKGLDCGREKYAVLLNSDTVVTPAWLSRMVRCAESDEKIAIVNPISNMAVNLSVQMPPGLNMFTMSQRISEISKRDYPDIVTAVGFCMLIKRESIENLGVFDEIYGMGYCEESDYCMRAVAAGKRVVACDDAFVYHKGCTSFGTWLERYYRNRKVFDSRWAEPYEKIYKEFLEKDPLGYLRKELARDLAVPKLDMGPVQFLYTLAKDAWRKGGIKEFAVKLPIIPLRLYSAGKRMAGQVFASKSPAAQDPAAKQNVLVTREYRSRLPKSSGMKIAFLIYHLDISGGVVSILQIVNELIARGHTAYIVMNSEEPDPGVFNLYTRPLRYRNIDEMARLFPEADIVVATFWPTAYEWLPQILEKNPRLRSVYFIQDFESWFYPQESKDVHAKILESYGKAGHRIVKSRWLQGKLGELNVTSDRIHLGLDLEVFYPRGGEKTGEKTGEKKRILMQAKPSEKRRGFANTLKVFGSLCNARPDIEPVFYGCADDELKLHKIPFPYLNAGIIRDQNKVADLYCSCDLVLDPSLFQGFGRPGLEAMACGVPTVLTREGGIMEYARDGVNTVLIDPYSIENMVNALNKVLDDNALRERLIANGLETARKYCHKDEAEKHIEFYEKIIKTDAV